MGSEYTGSNDSAKISSEQETRNELLKFSASDKILQQVQKVGSEEFVFKRRVSPRFQKIPPNKKPYYGSGQRRRLHASKDITTTENLSQLVAKVRSEGLLYGRRFSQRLKDKPIDKRPYYGSFQRNQLYASKNDLHDEGIKDTVWTREVGSPVDDAGKGNTKACVVMRKKFVQGGSNIRSDGSLLERRASPRFKYMPLDKRPFYGCGKRRQVDATKHNLCYGKNKGDDQMRVPYSPNEDVSEQITNLDRPVQECLPIATECAEDRATKSDSLLGFAPIKHDNKSVMDLQNGAYLEWTGCDSHLANSKHKWYGKMVRETVVNQIASSHLMQTYENSDSYTQSSGKQETDDDVFGVKMRRKVVQQLREKESKDLILERRLSPRLNNVPKEKRPYYGSTPKRRLNTTKNHVYSTNDQKRHLYSPKANIEKRDTKVDWVVQNCLLNVARKDICDPDTKSWRTSDCGPFKYENSETVASENGAYSKSISYKRFEVDTCHNTCARVKQKGGFELGRASRRSSRLLGLVCEDISNGEEDIPIPVTNIIDPPLAPTGFKYIKSIEVARNVILPPSPSGCKCKGKCTNPKTCSCARLNGSDFPYVHIGGGRLIEPKDVVFECGPGCGCGSKCINRTSQRGIKYRLEVYRTHNKGWAVRSWDFIPSGAFVCEYIGVLTRCADLDNIFENDFIFEIDCWHTMHGIEGRERRQGDVSKHARYLMEKFHKAQNETEFCIDGGSRSNVTRFINHSCDPNLFVQCVLSSHHDIRFARIVLFAADDIPPMQELSYDYGYALDSVIGPDGKIKKLPCYCGTSECRGRLY